MISLLHPEHMYRGSRECKKSDRFNGDSSVDACGEIREPWGDEGGARTERGGTRGGEKQGSYRGTHRKGR